MQNININIIFTLNILGYYSSILNPGRELSVRGLEFVVALSGFWEFIFCVPALGEQHCSCEFVGFFV